MGFIISKIFSIEITTIPLLTSIEFENSHDPFTDTNLFIFYYSYLTVCNNRGTYLALAVRKEKKKLKKNHRMINEVLLYVRQFDWRVGTRNPSSCTIIYHIFGVAWIFTMLIGQSIVSLFLITTTCVKWMHRINIYWILFLCIYLFIYDFFFGSTKIIYIRSFLVIVRLE